MVPSGSGRRLTAKAADAGAVIGALLDTTSVKGGNLSLDATLPPVSAETQKSSAGPDTAGELIIRNCTVLNQPFFTRALSSGSPSGVADLVKGQGIALDSVHIPFRMSGDVITIHDARATGPSLGFTADGYIDRATNQVALSGAVAPSVRVERAAWRDTCSRRRICFQEGRGTFRHHLHGAWRSRSPPNIDQPAFGPRTRHSPPHLRRFTQHAGGITSTAAETSGTVIISRFSPLPRLRARGR